MEYGSVIWSPTDVAQINFLESVQRRFTSYMSCFQTYDATLNMTTCTVPYNERLKRLKIYSLQRRRERYMIIYIYKIKVGLVQNPGVVFEYNPRTKLRAIPSNNTNINTKVRRMRETSFFNIAPRLFNTLPISLRELEVSSNSEKDSIETFKRKLDKHLANIPDLPGNILNTLLSE